MKHMPDAQRDRLADSADPAAFHRRDMMSARTIPRVTMLALGLALGIAIGWNQPHPWVWPWIGAAAAMLMLAAMVRRRRRFASLILGLAMAGIGASWVTMQQQFAAPDDLASFTGDSPLLVRVRGVATREPELRARAAGSMAQFDYRTPATYFPMRIDAVIGTDGVEHPLHGKALVRIDQPVPPFRAGDLVTCMGFLTLPNVPHNPGEFDYRQYARSLGQAGILTIADRNLLTVSPAKRNTIVIAIQRWRDDLRHRAGAWLLADLPETPGEDSQRNSLLVNLLLGERDAQIDGWYGSFQRIGLAHVMAISGFHLSVLAGFVLLVARITGLPRRLHGWLVISVVLLYLVLVEAQMPVLRAGIMTIAACLGLVFARRLRVSGLVAFSAIPLLLWRPDQLFNAGFQLTYGVVLALIHLAPIVRQRWWGPRRPHAVTVGEMLWESCKTTLSVSVTAWVVATPIVIVHFGMIAPLGAIASIFAVPISAALLAIGYTKMVLAATLPSASLLLGVPLAIGADLLLSMVKTIDEIPFSALHVPYPTTAWTLLAVMWTCGWSWRRTKWKPVRDVALWLSGLALAAWLWWPVITLAPSPYALRIDMIALGDGSCYVIRSGDHTMVFDAGSSSDLDAGRRTIIPALRRLGVRSIDAIAVSHADLDHYSAVLELMREFDVPEALLTPQFLQEAKDQPLGPTAHLVDSLTQRRIAIRPTFESVERVLGESKWTWLHPQADAAYEKTNDGSMVIRIDVAGRTALLCGDIGQEAIRRLNREHRDMNADVMELPHHGSSNREAHDFLGRLSPEVVLQSTGWRRMIGAGNERWAAQLSEALRLVTVRDGACWVRIGRDGAISTGRFLPAGRVASDPGE